MEWLSAPPVPTITDPIAWWTTMDAVGHPLARMALDYLSAPGKCHLPFTNTATHYLLATSTDVERAFSHGGLTVSKMRHALSDKSVRAATVLGSWCTFPELVPSKVLITSFNNKARRVKGGEHDGPSHDGGGVEPIIIEDS
jgi:hypothetical protein